MDTFVESQQEVFPNAQNLGREARLFLFPFSAPVTYVSGSLSPHPTSIDSTSDLISALSAE